MFGGLNDKVSAVVFNSPLADDSQAIYFPVAAVVTRLFAVIDAAINQDGTNGCQVDFTYKGTDGTGATAVGTVGAGTDANADWAAFAPKVTTPSAGFKVAAGGVIEIAYNEFGVLTPGDITAGVVYVDGQP